MDLAKRVNWRAAQLKKIRQYFDNSATTEVDTPLLRPFTVTDPYMSAFKVSPDQSTTPGPLMPVGYLQTSPEYAMKILLSEGCGDIYQLGKVFRVDEQGPFHRPEFTMLEWYRLGWHAEQLMDEVYAFIQTVAGNKDRVDFTYSEAFQKFLKIDPFQISHEELAIFSQEKLGELPDNMLFDNYLTLLFATCIEPKFAKNKITFVYDFPLSQASLAKKATKNGHQVGLRFEAYSAGLELANGFEELTDPKEQLARFQADNAIRETLNYPVQTIDPSFIDALKKGIPECSGVALGVDRLLMLAIEATDIGQVLPIKRDD